MQIKQKAFIKLILSRNELKTLTQQQESNIYTNPNGAENFIIMLKSKMQNCIYDAGVDEYENSQEITTVEVETTTTSANQNNAGNLI